jgi:hypothetical protein
VNAAVGVTEAGVTGAGGTAAGGTGQLSVVGSKVIVTEPLPAEKGAGGDALVALAMRNEEPPPPPLPGQS